MASQKGARTGQQLGSALGTAGSLLIPGAAPLAGLIGAGASALGGAVGGMFGKNRKKKLEEELRGIAKEAPEQSQVPVDMGVGAQSAAQQMMMAPGAPADVAARIAAKAIETQGRMGAEIRKQDLADFYAGQRDAIARKQREIEQEEMEQRQAGEEVKRGIASALTSPAMEETAGLLARERRKEGLSKAQEMFAQAPTPSTTETEDAKRARDARIDAWLKEYFDKRRGGRA